MKCPICNIGELLNMAGLLTCCVCQKMWIEYEFLRDCLKASLKYYFINDINGKCIIYDPNQETHSFIEKE